jgi:hypothetical protein
MCKRLCNLDEDESAGVYSRRKPSWLTRFLSLSAECSFDSPFNYLEISVASVVQISNASGSGESQPNTTRSTGRRQNTPSQDTPSRDMNPVLSQQQPDSEVRAAAVGSQASMMPSPEWSGVAQYAAIGLHGGEPRRLWTDEALQDATRGASGGGQGLDDSLRHRGRSGAQSQWLEWYMQEGGPPHLATDLVPKLDGSMPFFLYQVCNIFFYPMTRTVLMDNWGASCGCCWHG